MVASLLPPVLAPLTWLSASLPEGRDLIELPIPNGERCFGCLLYRPPKRSRWKPRTVDAIPPMHRGRKQIFYTTRNLAALLRDTREFNAREMRTMKPGRSASLWAIAVQLIAPFDETARPIDLLTVQGGNDHD